MIKDLILDDSNKARADKFFEFYELESSIENSDKKLLIGEKETPRKCRFCEKNASEVKFRSKAHVIPQFLGNKNLLSNFECDECNSLFSSYEDSFASFIGITRTLNQIKGESNKVPKFKDTKAGLEVFSADGKVILQSNSQKEPVIFDHKRKKMEIITERPVYTPIHVPKIIIKIALCMLRNEEVEEYSLAKKFILDSRKDHLFKDNFALRIYGYFIPGPVFFPNTILRLFKLKEAQKNVLLPKRQIVLFFGNNILQMILPFAHSDARLKGQIIELPIYPLLIDDRIVKSFGPYQKLSLNLTSHVKVRGQEHRLTYTFESIIDKLE